MEGKATLIGRALNGESQAINRLYEQYASVIRRFTYHIEPNAPEDRVHAVTLKVLELLKSPDQEFDQGFRQKFTAWLFKVAENEIRADRRKEVKASPRSKLDDGYSEPLGRLDSPSQMVFQREIDAILREQVNSLPSMYRDVLNLYFFQNLSQREIAEKLDLDELTIRKRMQRAYDRLRSGLKSVATTLIRAARRK